MITVRNCGHSEETDSLWYNKHPDSCYYCQRPPTKPAVVSETRFKRSKVKKAWWDAKKKNESSK